ncbi:MAG: alanine racemase [Ignavibacteria bacterium GWB2_35_12]|nr:MAG: alanine racemase [Ignavibacteria bacterium GWA2_35_8]OGU38653.1 MAG: alanine racemase [Ignavibacteria bacterium GWB2_35_12]OGU88149.1 MAG: alanine racemase [Ignavibacteria bacterium RIFOXYA2_FULL_35_10]OGV21942.1 MAG: alanine racemase [Ignavibacteria bacterium RIFOXYC2_FULL_35_21]
MRSTIAVINKSNLKHNLNRIREIAPNSKVMAIVKANAYGHGIVEISKFLEEFGVDYLGVAFADEGIIIREAGVKVPIVVLVPTFPEEAKKFVDYDLQASVSTYEFVKELSEQAVKAGKKVPVHLCIGTGMNREGIQPGDALHCMEKCKGMSNINFIGVCTHFATSSTDPVFVKRQLRLFTETIETLMQAGYNFPIIHTANSGAIANHPEAHFSIVRPGMSLYGYPPVPELADKLKVKPILMLKTKIVMMRKIRKGESVGYDRLFISPKPTTIATIPVGYGDGYFKTLTGKAQCLINGKKYNIVGTVCMDECMVDVGDDEINVGDEVVLIGNQGDEKITAMEIANKIGTIQYEVLTAISARVPRIYIEE